MRHHRATDATAAGEGGARLRIAYLCDADPADRQLYSGGNARIFEELQRQVGDVTVLPTGWGAAERLRRRVAAMPEHLQIRLGWRLRLALGRAAAGAVNRALRQGRYDVLFCAYSFHALAGVRVPEGTTLVYTSDATPTTYKHSEIGQSFGSFFGPSRALDPLIEASERRTFRRADLLLWPSRWLTEAVNARYALDPARSMQLPWGANVPDPGPDPDPPRLVPGRPVRLLLVGRDWQAKGGPTTLAVLRELRRMGLEAQLTIVGCDPEDARGKPGVTIHPHLDKADPAQMALFEELYRRSHFLVMPSYESYGFAFCEASAYGLPSLCLSVGGVPVRNGRNGHALDPEAGARDFAGQITAYLDDPAAYDRLRLTSRTEYETRLNWEAWGRGCAQAIRAVRAGG